MGVEAVEDSSCLAFQAWSHSSFSELLAGLGVGTQSWPSGLTSPWWYLVIGPSLMEVAPRLSIGSPSALLAHPVW